MDNQLTCDVMRITQFLQSLQFLGIVLRKLALAFDFFYLKPENTLETLILINFWYGIIVTVGPVGPQRNAIDLP